MQELDKMVEEICENAFFMDDDLVKEKNRDENKLYISFSKLKKIIFSYLMHDDGWIPVEERLPEGKALACDKYGEIAIGYIGGSADGCYECEDDTYIMFNVIAWRPLPEPYQPETTVQRPEWQDRMLHTFLGGHHD